MSGKDYFKRAITFSLLDEIAFFARKRIFKIFMKTIRPLPHETIIDIGVFGGSEDPNWNFLEQLYEYPERITTVGIDDANFLERQYLGLKFVKTVPDTPLPFKENQFDIGFSGAVIEHVGSYHNQKFFLEEAIRVCCRLFLTTPNRFYPVELHTRLPLIHWLPQPIFHKIISKMGLEFYSKEENLNLLSKNQLLNLVPRPYRTKVTLRAYRLFGLTSNLILLIKKESNKAYE